MSTNLNRLNELLKDPALGLPQFRTSVSPAFANLNWLKEKLPRNPACNDELKGLLSMSQAELLKDNKA